MKARLLGLFSPRSEHGPAGGAMKHIGPDA